MGRVGFLREKSSVRGWIFFFFLHFKSAVAPWLCVGQVLRHMRLEYCCFRGESLGSRSMGGAA